MYKLLTWHFPLPRNGRKLKEFTGRIWEWRWTYLCAFVCGFGLGHGTLSWVNEREKEK